MLSEKGLRKCAILKLYVNEANTELVELYKKHIEKHNESIHSNSPYSNSGFELFMPDEKIVDIHLHAYLVNMNIKVKMSYFDGIYEDPSAYYILPHSNMVKTQLMLANHTVVVDSGYRGWLNVTFRWLNELSTDITNDYVIDKHAKLLQICHPMLCPIFVEMIEEKDILDTNGL